MIIDMMEFETDRFPAISGLDEAEATRLTHPNFLHRFWLWGTPAFPRLARAIVIFVLAPVILLALVGLMENAMEPKTAFKVEDMSVSVPEGAEPMESTSYGYGVAWSKHAANTAQLTKDIANIGNRLTERAIYLPRVRRAVDASLNGQPLIALGGPSREQDYKTFEPHIFIVPPSSATGSQILKMDFKTRQTQPYVAEVLIGPTAELRPAWVIRQFLAVSLIFAAAGICALSALLSLALALRQSDRYASISFGALMLAWLAINMYYLGVTSNWSINLSRAFYSAASFVLILASLNYINEWTFKLRVVRTRLVPILSIALFVKIIPIFFDNGQFYQYILLSAEAIAAFCMVFLVTQLFLYLSRNKDVSVFTATILLICVLSVVMDLLYAMTPAFGRFFFPDTGITLHYGPVFSALLALTIIAGFANSFLQTQTALSNSNQILSSKLVKREAEILKVYAARETEMRDAALVEERKRIMRDMHDGVGGKLLSLSLRAKSDKLSPSEMGLELENSLQDLRLIVDSMDTADGDLEMALGALRGRLEPALHEAGIELDWDAGELGPQPAYGPQHVLSIYRMIQEAVTNVIRHSGATTLSFKSRVVDADWIEICVCDNGHGLEIEKVRTGSKGLSNLRSRAAELGGRVEFVTENKKATGLNVRIFLPNHLGQA